MDTREGWTRFAVMAIAIAVQIAFNLHVLNTKPFKVVGPDGLGIAVIFSGVAALVAAAVLSRSSMRSSPIAALLVVGLICPVMVYLPPGLELWLSDLQPTGEFGRAAVAEASRRRLLECAFAGVLVWLCVHLVLGRVTVAASKGASSKR